MPPIATPCIPSTESVLQRRCRSRLSPASSFNCRGSDEEDAQKLEAILGAVFTSSPSKGRLEPAERQSLLLFDKDLAEEEDLEAGIHTSFVTLSLCFAS